MQLPTEDRYSYDDKYILNQIAILFGGRIAEEVFMHHATTGASNDFERATSLARDMVTRYGMSENLGPMVYAEKEGEVFLGKSVTKSQQISEATMQKVDQEIRRIIDQQYALARRSSRITVTRWKRWLTPCLSGKRSTATRLMTSWPASSPSPRIR